MGPLMYDAFDRQQSCTIRFYANHFDRDRVGVKCIYANDRIQGGYDHRTGIKQREFYFFFLPDLIVFFRFYPGGLSDDIQKCTGIQ